MRQVYRLSICNPCISGCTHQAMRVPRPFRPWDRLETALRSK